MLVEANWSMVAKPRAGSPKQSASSSGERGWRLGAVGSVLAKLQEVHAPSSYPTDFLTET